MKQLYLSRVFQLTWGLFLFAFGVAITINAQIGYAPWDVFHAGLAKTTGISIGNVSIIVGIFIGLLYIFLGEKVGLGTIFNMVLIGIFLDIIISLHIIPIANNFIWSIPMLVVGIIIIAIGTCFYMKTGLGSGPRDGLMVALSRKTGLPIGICRGMIEISVVTIGWKLGGMVGIGTILAAFTIGFWIQVIFKLFKFDATKVKHEAIDQTYRNIFKKYHKS